MKCDVIIKNGLIVDPSTGREEVGDVFINDGVIVSGDGIEKADSVFDASGMLVFPGLIDYHTHLFWRGTENGIPADLSLLPQGVTTAVDAGSAGAANIGSFLEKIVYGSCMRIKAFVNLSPAGLTTLQYPENIDPKYWDRAKIKDLFQQYPDIIKGLKIRISKDIAGGLGLKPLEAAAKLASELGTRLAVHSTDPPETMGKVAEYLNEGDILVHCFHGTGHTILDKEGNIAETIKKARKRGIIMDSANGRNNWAFAVAEAAIKQRFLPDVISTDLTIKTLFKDPVFGLPYVMSKYLALGLSLQEVVACCTVTPAKLLGMEGTIGTLSPGACGDVSVFELMTKEVSFSDVKGETRCGDQILVPHLTVLKGKISYRSF